MIKYFLAEICQEVLLMTLKLLIVPPGTSERSYQPIVYLHGLPNNYRTSDHFNDHQRNKEEITF